ncbi:MAG: CRISPR-associated protein Csx3 [Phototrophicales bacterium]|nr:MAG: CRISPR-associated protein Csx3 [Phototrophicales bacterium]
MKYFNVELQEVTEAKVLMNVGFGEPADNHTIVRELDNNIDAIAGKLHGKYVFINGRMSLPVAFVIAHALAHIAKAIFVYDPKMTEYICVVTHDPNVKLGDVRML